MFASMFGRNQVLEFLLLSGAETAIRDIQGQTAADHAAMQGNEEGLELLSKRGESLRLYPGIN
jgi:ankyrin repeat protein